MKVEELNRNEHKTSEGEFLYELRNSYELSPRISRSILDTAKECLILNAILKEGQIEVSVISIEEPSGKSVEAMKKQRVKLTLDNGLEDKEILKEFGRISLRQVKIERITSEAIEQGGILTQEDLSKYLGFTERTIRRDISEIKKRGIEVTTRGLLHNIGRGQTHKVKIVCMYLDGSTFSEIKLRTRHSIGAIKRYMHSFVKVLMSYHNSIKSTRDISSVTGLSERLVLQYIDIITKGYKSNHRRMSMENLISQWKRAGTSLKKSIEKSWNWQKMVHMTGGGI